jgi:hypothetical protein
MSNQAPGIDEYEKSCYLTDAKKAIVLEIATGKFEVTEQARRSIDSLVKTANLSPEVISSKEKFEDTYRINTSTQLFLLPSDVWFITYEAATYDSKEVCAANKVAEVIPVTQDNLHRIISNPFKGPSLGRVLRLDCGNSEIELISKEKIKTYKVRYIAAPKPIILANLATGDYANSGLSIDGETEITECDDVHESLHQAIVERAVLLAKQSWVNLKAYNNNK